MDSSHGGDDGGSDSDHSDSGSGSGDDSTSSDDTGDAPDRCDRDLHGGRNIKICGTAETKEVGTDVSSGTMADGTTLLGLGSKGNLDDAGDVQVDLFQDPNTSGWATDGIAIADSVTEGTNFFGRALELGADLDGDGEADLAVSAASGAEPSPVAPGQVYVYYGPLDAPRAVSDADAIVTSDTDDGGIWYGGLNMADVPDIDGDGDDELLTGGFPNGEGEGFHCVPTLLLGPIASMSRYDAAATYLSGRDEEGAIHNSPGVDSLAADMNSDGVAEIMLSESAYYPWYGAVYIIPGDLRGDVIVEDVDAIYGDLDGAISGLYLSAGDVDGDGANDLSIGTSNLGIGWIFTGTIDSTFGTADATATLGIDASDGANGSLVAGDLDGDTVGDDVAFLVGNTSEIYVYAAPIAPGAHTLADAILAAWDDGDVDFGWSLEPIPDLDGDGADELLIGASYDDEGGTYAGAAYLLYGASW